MKTEKKGELGKWEMVCEGEVRCMGSKGQCRGNGEGTKF